MEEGPDRGYGWRHGDAAGALIQRAERAERAERAGDDRDRGASIRGIA